MIEALLTKEIAIVSTLSAHRVWPLAIVKSRHLRWSSLKNTPLLLVRWQDTQESRYQTFLGAYWWASFTLLAIPGQNNLVSNLLLFIILAVAMFAQFHLSLSFCCYWQLLLLDDLSVLFFFASVWGCAISTKVLHLSTIEAFITNSHSSFIGISFTKYYCKISNNVNSLFANEFYFNGR